MTRKKRVSDSACDVDFAWNEVALNVLETRYMTLQYPRDKNWAYAYNQALLALAERTNYDGEIVDREFRDNLVAA